jgi:hypothetical protein
VAAGAERTVFTQLMVDGVAAAQRDKVKKFMEDQAVKSDEG